MLKITHTDRYVDYAGTEDEESCCRTHSYRFVKLADGKVVDAIV